jgi:hypothetical protein
VDRGGRSCDVSEIRTASRAPWLASVLSTLALPGHRLVRDLHSVSPGNPGKDPQRLLQVRADTCGTANAAARGAPQVRVALPNAPYLQRP